MCKRFTGTEWLEKFWVACQLYTQICILLLLQRFILYIPLKAVQSRHCTCFISFAYMVLSGKVAPWSCSSTYCTLFHACVCSYTCKCTNRRSTDKYVCFSCSPLTSSTSIIYMSKRTQKHKHAHAVTCAHTRTHTHTHTHTVSSEYTYTEMHTETKVWVDGGFTWAAIP